METNNNPAPNSPEVAHGTVPAVMRFSAVVVLLQCAAMFIYAASLIVSQFTEHTSTLESDSPAANYVNILSLIHI